MNATDALNRIADLLGMRFKSEKFFQTKLVEGDVTVTNNNESPLSVGDSLFVVGEDNIMTPAPAGRHETREGLIVVVSEDGSVSAIEDRPEEETPSTVSDAETQIEVNEEALSEATLTDGTKIMTDEDEEFAPGQYAYVITQEGEKVGAPEGEHTTESGIVLTIDSEHRITGVKYPDESGEGSLEDMKKEMKEMKQAMSQMFTILSGLSKDYETFKSQPVFKEPVVKKTFGKENLLDAKVRFLKNNLLN